MKDEIQERLNLFLNKLYQKTRADQISWECLGSYPNIDLLLEELLETPGLYIDFYTNSVNIKKSYYVKNKSGTLFLLYIWHSSSALEGEYFMFARLNEYKDLIYFDFREEFYGYISRSLWALAETIEMKLEKHRDLEKDLCGFLEQVVGQG